MSGRRTGSLPGDVGSSIRVNSIHRCRQRAHQRRIYAALGYPHSTTKRIAQRGFRAQPLIFASGALDPDEYERLGLNPHIHLAIQCDQKKVRSDKGVHSLKALDGVSGGALLRLPSRNALMQGAQPTLAGIITEQDTQGQALIAIRIDGILVAMSHTPALWAY
jgi:hypothetical protein